jgi:hypothetical protein
LIWPAEARSKCVLSSIPSFKTRFLESGSQRPLTVPFADEGGAGPVARLGSCGGSLLAGGGEKEIGFCADSGFAGFNRGDRRWIKVWRGVGSGKSIY